MASITGWMGDGLQGTPGGCEGSYDNPVVNFGEPFGHAHVDDLDNMIANCTCSIYGAKTSFDLTSLSTCHEVVFIYYRAVGSVDGRTYRIQLRTEKGGNETTYIEYEFVWGDAWSYYHGYYFFGWTPCFMWPGGSDYDPNYVEITDNGTDYEAFVELWDTVTETKVAEYTQTFTITNLVHTVMSGTIQNYAGENVKGDIRIRAEYTLPSGACSDGLSGYTGEVYYQRAADDDYSYNINVDGMEGLVRITPYKCGYVKKEIEFSGITAKDLNTNNDFTGSDYLPSTVQGRVIDTDTDPINNANVFSEDTNYGAKTNSNGYYAMPYCNTGNHVPAAIKNNFNKSSGNTVSQSGNHPTSTTTRNFTLTRQSEATGNYAHENELCVFDQSVIIPDDPVTGTGTLIKAQTVGTTTVKAKTRKWGTGAALGTSTGPGTSYQQNGEDGYNADGDTGDAESWE